MKTLILISILFYFVTANEIDLCIQRKLKLSEPIDHKNIQRDIQNENLKKFRYSARFALQICHPTFDIIAGQIFKKMTKPQVPLTQTELKCYELYLLKQNPEGLLVPELDKNLLNGFEGSDECDGIVKNYIDTQIKIKMPAGTEGELKCMDNSIEKYMNGRIKAFALSKGGYSLDIFYDEKNRFVKELREVSDDLIECINNL
ncbi:unnamed protein product [Chironomus riparius]|uniref:Uncharacterized protein n=1 Tax=Chironomus riparius TaxID=315576 RepID=A0A9N9S6G4_9DIPT|nr:unnamed protein product [Chironomus riparius]